MRAAPGASRWNRKIARSAIENLLHRVASARPAAACMPAVRATIKSSPPCGCTCVMPPKNCGAGRRPWRTRLDALAARHVAMVLPGYTHMQQAMPSSVALWAQGFAAEIRDDAEGLALTQRRIGKNPLGSAAGYGRRILISAARRRGYGWDSRVTQEPVTAAQLSRGKAEAHLLFETALLAQDMGRLAADLMLFYTQEFGFVTLASGLYHRLLDHAAEAQSGRLRTGARPQFGRASGAQRSARTSLCSSLPAITASCS